MMLFENTLIKIYKLARQNRHLIPERLQSILCAVSAYINPGFKYSMYREWWDSRRQQDGGVLSSAGYRSRILAIAGEKDDDFLKGKIVADFGCGPRGSLQWGKQARLRIGIDVMAKNFPDWFNVRSHDICYVCSTERKIPLPSNYVDIMFTKNAIDHVHNFKAICHEIIRVISPGGEFIGSINLCDRVTISEPNALTEKKVKKHLLRYLEVTSYRLDPEYTEEENKRINEELGRPGVRNDPSPDPGVRVLWVRARKPVS
jgi:SAM-dependent methyltransferase